ncbi:MAG: acylneuraminate cytidylyltransferase family protein [Lachnospiraceae bacterium]|nr:acylneuraminate cytidylyltransferase family protein [Lachnospiraceae bacterium]
MSEIKTAAFIPVRGGSKSIPLKNIKEIAGKPLVYWTVKAACDCKNIDVVYVATDSDKIRETVEGFYLDKVKVIGRSEESASDTASTESALLEFAERYEFENVVLIQATSPLLTGNDLEGGFRLYMSDKTDSVLSVVRQKRFNWEPQKDGTVKPSNYDVFYRPRRQEFDGYLVENGAFYITSRKALINLKYS